MKKSTVIITILALIIIIGVIIALPANKEEKPKQVITKEETIKVGYRTHNLYLPLFIGLDQGYFENNGLKIEPVKFESTNQLMESLIAGRIDAALGGVNTFLLFNIEQKSSNEFKIFSIVKESVEIPLSYLLIREDSDINSIQELKGKKIGSYPGSTARLLYRKVVSKYFKPEETALLQMSPDLELQALESKQVDAIIVLEPLATIAINKGLAKPLENSLFSKYIVDDLYLATSVVSTKFLKDSPDLSKKFINAASEAMEFINNNPVQAKESLLKYTPLEESVVDKIKMPYYLNQEEIDESELQALADLLFEEKELDSKINVASMLLNE